MPYAARTRFDRLLVEMTPQCPMHELLITKVKLDPLCQGPVSPYIIQYQCLQDSCNYAPLQHIKDTQQTYGSILRSCMQ